LDENKITLLLREGGWGLDESDSDSDSDGSGDETFKVTVDLALSGHANARKYYEIKKHSQSKEERTVASTKLYANECYVIEI